VIRFRGLLASIYTELLVVRVPLRWQRKDSEKSRENWEYSAKVVVQAPIKAFRFQISMKRQRLKSSLLLRTLGDRLKRIQSLKSSNPSPTS